MKKLLVLLMLNACSGKQNYKNKYVIIVETTSHSIMTNKEEIETKIDSVYAKDAVSAFDSAALEVYGIIIADSVVYDALKKNKNEVDYKYYKTEIKKVKVLDYLGNEISIPDTVKNRIYKDYGIKPFN